MLTVAITLQTILLLYHQATTRFDFFPFNGSRFYPRREREIEAGVNLALMSLPLIGFIFRFSPLMWFGVGYYPILLGIELATWWIPYLFGASPKWLELHARIHSQTIMVLPRKGNHPRPNLEHLILMVLTLLTGVATVAAYHSIQGAPFQQWRGVLIVGAILAGGTAYQSCIAGRKKSNSPPA